MQTPVLLVPTKYVLDVEGNRVPDIPASVASWGQVNDDLDTHSLPFSTKRPVIVAKVYDESDLRDWANMPGNRTRRLSAKAAQWGIDARNQQRGPAFRRAAVRKMTRNSEGIARSEVHRRRRVDAVRNILLPIIGNIGMAGLCKAIGVPEAYVLAAPTNIVGLTGTITHWEDIAHADRQPPTLASGYQAMHGLAPLGGDGTWNGPVSDGYYPCWNNSQTGGSSEGNGRIYGNNNGNAHGVWGLAGSSISTTRHFSRIRSWNIDNYRSFAAVAFTKDGAEYGVGQDYYECGYNSSILWGMYRRTAAGTSTTMATTAVVDYNGYDYGEEELSFDESWMEAYTGDDNVLMWFGRDTAHLSGQPAFRVSGNNGVSEIGFGDLDAVTPPAVGEGSSVSGSTIKIGRRGVRAF